MKLYQFALSPNCQKVVALAHEVGIPLTTVPVDLFAGGTRTPEMLAKNPNGKVPILEDGDFVLWESHAMLGYLASKADRNDLAPNTPLERANVDRWLSWQSAHFGPAVAKVAFERVVKKLASLGPADEAIVQKGIAEFASTAKVLDDTLAKNEYLTGKLSIADFAVVTYAALTEHCGLDMQPYPHARAWLSRMMARPSVQYTFAAARGAA